MNRPGLSDGFAWLKGITSNPDVWTLQDPNGANVAHIMPGSTCWPSGVVWWAMTDQGDILATVGTWADALAVVDNEYRPCAAAKSDVIACDNDRAPRSRYCAAHQLYMATTPDPDRPDMWMCGCLVNDSSSHRIGCPSYLEK